MDDTIFALDIGTRTVVGLVLKQEGDTLHLVASKVLEHEQRAMQDGQIHRVEEVAALLKRVTSELERDLGQPLHKVAIAAAGRALKTVRKKISFELERAREVRAEDVINLDYQAIQSAQQDLVEESRRGDYHFVGYSTVINRIDGIEIGDLEGQRGQLLEVELIATFLPRIVVDSLLNAVHRAGLEVNYMTLEPIAAANLIIPKELHNLNLALIDIGAGTSDIAITEKGSIKGYAMVPVAGDEITEKICDEYLLDFSTGEKVKKALRKEQIIYCRNMLDQDLEIEREEILQLIEPVVEELTYLISQEIQRVNEKSPQAVMCVGGGSLTPLLQSTLAEALGLKKSRVAIKSREEIKGIEGKVEGISMAQAITPLGIAKINRDEKMRAHFIEVIVNKETVHLFTLTQPTISDALLAAGIDIRKIRGRPGLALTVEVFQELRSCKGTLGTPGKILLNHKEENLEAHIEDGDTITIEFGIDGEPGEGLVRDVLPELEEKSIILNGEEKRLAPIIYMDGERVDPSTPLKDRSSIEYYNYTKVDHILKWLWELKEEDILPRILPFTLNGEDREIKRERYTITIEGEVAHREDPIHSGDTINVVKKSWAITAGQIIREAEGDQSFHITLNGKKWEIPPKSYALKINGEWKTLDTEIRAGDDIDYDPLPLKFNEVLGYVNYSIPSQPEGRPILLKNDTEVGFTETIQDGDRLEIRWGS